MSVADKVDASHGGYARSMTIPKSDTEFGGGPGLIQSVNVANQHFDEVEQMWIVYASDTEDPGEPDPGRVGTLHSDRTYHDPVSGTAPLPPLNSRR